MNDALHTPRCSFIIANFNGGDLLRQCLDSISAQTDQDFEVIVVDNGSTDESYQLPHFARHHWTLHRLPANTGFAAANNLGWEQARGALIALVNNDVVLAPEWLAAGVACFEAHPDAGSVATRILQQQRPDVLDSAGFRLHACFTVSCWQGRNATLTHAPAPHRPFGAVATAALYRAAALRQTGLFDARYFAYYEDTDLAVRLRLFGYACAFAPDAVCTHVGSATFRRGSAFHTYHLRRNVEYAYWTGMIGRLAFLQLPAHVLFECIACLAACGRGHGTAALRAKGHALRDAGWIWRERRRRRQLLNAATGGIAAARSRLASALSPCWQRFRR